MRPERIASASALIASAALLAAPWRGHVDDFDAQIHTVIARNVVRDHSWFNLRYLPGYEPVFRDHLPFGFWPAAAAIRVAGEGAIDPLYALMTLGAIAVSGAIARRIGGAWAAAAAMMLLGTCESIWQYGGRLLLDAPLFLFATAAVGTALADRWRAAAVLAAVATLIKGPFGLLPLLCVAIARWRDRRGALAVMAAVLPLALFLAIDPGGGWRSGYLHGQLFASATGARGAGAGAWWFPLAVVGGRFWPGFPFVALAVWQARRKVALRPLLWTCALMIAALCLPERKWGNHTYVAFPFLGAIAGVAAASLIEGVREKILAAATATLAAVACVVSVSGLGARVLRPPCPFSTALAGPLAKIPAGTPIAVVSGDRDLGALAILAAERDLSPFLESSLATRPDLAVAVVRNGIEVPSAWRAVAEGSGWVLAERTFSAPESRRP